MIQNRGMKDDPALGCAALGFVILFALSPMSCVSAKHPRSAADVAAAEGAWSQQVCSQIRDYWNPWDVVQTAKSTEPSPARPTTVLRIAVQADGTAPRPQIVGSSGISALDDAAIRAVTAALPLPTPPPELLSGASSLPFVLGFRVVPNEDSNVAPLDQKQDPFAVITASLEDKTPGVADRSDVQRTVETYRRDVVTCLDRHRDDAGAQAIGEVMIEFVISKSGEVHHPVVLRTRGSTRSLEGCLVRRLSRWTFLKPTGGAVKVVFPFRFGAGQAAGADMHPWSLPPSPPKL